MANQFGGFAEVTLPQVWHTLNRTLGYLKEHSPQMLERIANAYGCYNLLLALPTGCRFHGQLYYPYNLPFYEGLEELDSSLVLAFSGQYKSAIQHLRFFLELAYLGLYMIKPIDETWVQKWLIGEEKTPAVTHILSEIEKENRVKVLCSLAVINLRTECYKVYDELSKYVHTRGYFALGTSIRGSNFPMLNLGALKTWANLLHSVVRVIAMGMIARFPQGLQRLPLYDKFGFADAPRGGFLEPFEVDEVERVFEYDLLSRLRQFSDLHHGEVLIAKWERLQQVPNLSLEALKLSLDKWWAVMKLADRGNVPNKTWYASVVTPNTTEESDRLGNAETPEDFVKVATQIVRQMNAGDESILAQAYTINLLQQKGLPIYKP